MSLSFTPADHAVIWAVSRFGPESQLEPGPLFLFPTKTPSVWRGRSVVEYVMGVSRSDCFRCHPAAENPRTMMHPTLRRSKPV